MSWRLQAQKTGLLVIDLQDKLLAVMPEKERVLKKVTQVIQVARLLELPIFVTEQRPEKLGATVEVVREALEKFQPIAKLDFSAAGVLPADLPKTLWVCGLETHVCVRQTIYDLRQKEKSIYLLADAVCSRSELDHALAIQEMRQDRVLVTSVEAVAWEMVGRAEGELFKKMLAILK